MIFKSEDIEQWSPSLRQGHLGRRRTNKIFAMDKPHRAVDSGDDGVGAGRCTNTIHTSIIGVCLGRFTASSHHVGPSGLRRGDLRLLFCCLSGYFTLIHPYRALGSTRGRHHGLPFGLVRLASLQPSNINAAFSRGRFFLSHAEAGWIASTPTARNFLLPRGQGRVAWLGGVCYITQVSMAAINLCQVSDILPDVTIKPALTWVFQWLLFFR